jgi:hypothetical protein
MENVINKITKVLDNVYGWGIMLALFLGGLTFFGFLAAFVIGGETSVAITTFIYKSFFRVVIYAANVIVILGLISMYLKGEKSLTVKDDNCAVEASEEER